MRLTGGGHGATSPHCIYRDEIREEVTSLHCKQSGENSAKTIEVFATVVEKMGKI